MKLEDIKAGEQLKGVYSLEKVKVMVLSVFAHGPNSVNLIYRTQDNQLREWKLFCNDDPPFTWSMRGKDGL